MGFAPAVADDGIKKIPIARNIMNARLLGLIYILPQEFGGSLKKLLLMPFGKERGPTARVQPGV
jgi:hypothetical protein